MAIVLVRLCVGIWQSIANTTQLMQQAAKNLDFLQAAQYRDEIVRLQELLNKP